jgi:hypothetical protein
MGHPFSQRDRGNLSIDSAPEGYVTSALSYEN